MTIKVTYNTTDIYVSESISATYINVSYEVPSDGGGAVWGDITGTLSDQTDLQNALNAKFDDPTGTTAQYLRGDGTLATFPSLTGFVPYTGATANVDLGTHTILAQNATISSSGSGNTATITHSSGSGIALNITKGGNGEGLYINKTSGSGNAATIIGTLNATTLVKSGGLSTEYLKADGSVSTLTNPITGTGTAGQVAYFTGATTQAGSNNLFWDNANGRLGIGTATPAASLTINSAATLATGIRFDNAGSVGSIFGDGVSMTIRSGATHGIQINTGSASLQQSNSSTGGFRIDLQTLTNAPIYSYLADADTGIGRAAADTLTFYAGGEKARIFSTGNLLVQNGGTFTDSGQRLQVTGDTLLKGSGNTSATTALTVQDSGGTALFRVRNDGTSISRGGIFYGSGLNNTITTSNDTNSLDVGGLNFSILFGSFDTAGYGVAIYGFNATRRTATSGLSGTLNVSHGYAPTSGTGTYRMLNLEGTINQTGGANGITRGLYVNPILTAAADWRSIEWSNNSGWGLYGAGTSNNYLGGSLGIGSTALTGISLRVGKNITGGTTGVGISSSGVIKNDVTTNAILVVSSAFSDTSGFNTTNVYHYLANRGGYSSTATNAYGYFVDSTVNYATNNYAFYGNIAAATNSWNLYMNGTADNYLGGRLSIGTTSQSQGLRIGRNPTTNDSRTIFVNVAIQNTVTSKYVGFSSSIGLNASGFTLPDLVHFEAINDGTHTASVVTNLYGFRENLGTYSATNVYGHYGNIPSGTNRWNLYMNGTANNYMAGRLGLGTTSLTNVTFRNNLQISGSGTSYLNVYEGTIQNGVTVGAYYNFTSPVTLASSFTTTDVYSYGAGNATIGAGSAITNLYGFHVAALTAATNNYGFYGNIAAATNRWNFYANGTAANYFNGNTLIGSTTDSGEKLQVTGTAKITGASSFGGNMTLSLNQNAATNITVSNTTSGTTSEASLSATSSNGTVAVSKYSATRTTYRILAANDGFLYNGTSGDLVIFNDFSTGNIKFGAGGTSTEQMRLTSAGNLCIGVSSGGDFLNIAASTTAKAQINLASGTAPTSPNNGDIWFTGTELKIQVGGVTKTFTLV